MARYAIAPDDMYWVTAESEEQAIEKIEQMFEGCDDDVMPEDYRVLDVVEE